MLPFLTIEELTCRVYAWVCVCWLLYCVVCCRRVKWSPTVQLVTNLPRGSELLQNVYRVWSWRLMRWISCCIWSLHHIVIG